MRILTCSPLWKALMKRRKRASGWPRGERSLAACHSRGRAEKVGDQRAVTELGPCPSRKPRRAGSAATLRKERRGSWWSPRVPSSETNGHVVTSRFPWVLSLFWPSHSLSSEKNIQTGSLARRTLDFPWMSLRTILLEAWSPALLPSFKRGPSGRRPPTPKTRMCPGLCLSDPALALPPPCPLCSCARHARPRRPLSRQPCCPSPRSAPPLSEASSHVAPPPSASGPLRWEPCARTCRVGPVLQLRGHGAPYTVLP